MIGKPEEIMRWLWNQDREKLFEIKQHREKRSLTANAYAWVLIGKIADVIRASKDEVYLMMLKRYGQSEVISVLANVSLEGYFKYFDIIGQGIVNDTLFSHYRVYKGSSEYDTREMAVLIDGIISEAKELDIETLPPAEIARMKNLWRAE